MICFLIGSVYERVNLVHMEQSSSPPSTPRRVIVALMAVMAVIAVTTMVVDTNTQQSNEITANMGFPLRTPSGADAPASVLYRTKIKFTTDTVSTHHANDNKCSASQTSTINKAINTYKGPLNYAMKNKNQKNWNLYFGKPTQQKTDADVQGILSDAQKYYGMFNKAGGWTAECCGTSVHSSEECATCVKNPSTLAFAMSATYSDGTKLSYKKIKICANAMNEEPMTLGLTLFHELIHMVSGAKDNGGSLNDYMKTTMVQVARNDPTAARSTANNFAMYITKSGMTHAKFDKYTAGWGRSSEDANCYDGYSNCADLAGQNQCQYSNIKSGCCEACKGK